MIVFMRRVCSASFASLVIMFSGCAHAPAPAPAPAPVDRFAPLNAALDTQARALMLPGVSAALMERGKLMWTGTRGWANVETRTPVTPETPFNVASLTKPMASVMLMQLVERGKLSLDTPAQRYEPSITDARITVRHLLTMTSESDPPGEHYKYNGNKYGLLGSVVTGASGETLAQAFSTRVIEPLGLTQTAPGAVPTNEKGLSAEQIAHYQSIMARLAVPYNMYGGVEPVATLPPDPQIDAAANIVSTASDYARFADAIMRGELLEHASREAMWTNAMTSSGERLPYALGWFVEDYHGHHLIYHYGYYPRAYSAIVLIVPERELVFVALANGNGLHAGNGIDPVEGQTLACTVLLTYVDSALPCAEKAAANVKAWQAQVIPPRHEMTSDPAVLAQYAGKYDRKPYGDEPARVWVEQGRLWWQTVQQPFPMTQEAPDRFFMKADDRTLVFVRDASGRITSVDLKWPDVEEVFSLPRM